VREVLVGVGEHVLYERALGGGQDAELDQPPPRLQQVVPAQHTGAPLRETRAAEVELADAVAVAPRPAGADLALQQHHELGVKAQHTVEALPAARVADLAVGLGRFGVGGQKDRDQPPALDLPAGGALLGGVDDVGRLHVHGAVGQLALRGLADRPQQRLAGERHEPQHDHRGARELILVRAPEVPVGVEDVQVRVGSGAVHSPLSVLYDPI
jgi:hypothetical protein